MKAQRFIETRRSPENSRLEPDTSPMNLPSAPGRSWLTSAIERSLPPASIRSNARFTPSVLLTVFSSR